MFDYLSGNVASLGQNLLVIDTHGIGWSLIISSKCAGALSGKKEAKVYTYLNMGSSDRQVMELFGFSDKSELTMFKLLISVSGVGARTAIAILGAVSPEKFAYAVSVGDVKGIKAPGVGPKIAARIILELKDKIAKDFATETAGTPFEAISAPVTSPKDANKLTEARTALMALGFSKQESEALMRKIDCTKLSVEDIIREALKHASSL